MASGWILHASSAGTSHFYANDSSVNHDSCEAKNDSEKLPNMEDGDMCLKTSLIMIVLYLAN